MALAITNIDPNSGLTRGFTNVVIDGTDIDFTPLPPASGSGVPLPPPDEPIELLFNGIPAHNVAVVDLGGGVQKIFCNTPPYSGDYDQLPKAVDVKLTNLLSSGTITVTDGFTYTRQNLTSETDFGRVVRQLIITLRNAIIRNVTIRSHRDFDDTVADLLNITKLASLPALVLYGPGLRRNRFYEQHGPIEVQDSNGIDVDVTRSPPLYDLMFRGRVVSKGIVEALSIQTAVVRFFDVNTELKILADTSIPNEYVDYEIELEDDVDWESEAGSASIVGFSFEFFIRAVPIDESIPVVLDKTKTTEDEPTVYVLTEEMT